MPRLPGWRALKVGERCRAGEAADLGLVERTLERPAVEDGGEVEERSGRRGDGDAVFGRHLVGWENGAVRTQPWAGVQGPRRGDVDPRAARVADAPQRRSRPVAQDSARAGREDGGHPAPVSREGSVPDCVHASVDGVESAGLDPMSDGTPANAEREQLDPPTTPCCTPASAAINASADRPGGWAPMTGSSAGSIRIGRACQPRCVSSARGLSRTCHALARELRVGEGAVVAFGPWRAHRSQPPVGQVRERAGGEQAVEVRVVRVGGTSARSARCSRPRLVRAGP